MPGRGASGLVVALTFAAFADFVVFEEEATLAVAAACLSDFAEDFLEITVSETTVLDVEQGLEGALEGGLEGDLDAGFVLDLEADLVLTTVLLETAVLVVTSSLPVVEPLPATAMPLSGATLTGTKRMGAARRTGVGVKSIGTGGGGGGGTGWYPPCSFQV